MAKHIYIFEHYNKPYTADVCGKPLHVNASGWIECTHRSTAKKSGADIIRLLESKDFDYKIDFAQIARDIESSSADFIGYTCGLPQL